jgi:hypothetical protein
MSLLISPSSPVPFATEPQGSIAALPAAPFESSPCPTSPPGARRNSQGDWIKPAQVSEKKTCLRHPALTEAPDPIGKNFGELPVELARKIFQKVATPDEGDSLGGYCRLKPLLTTSKTFAAVIKGDILLTSHHAFLERLTKQFYSVVARMPPHEFTDYMIALITPAERKELVTLILDMTDPEEKAGGLKNLCEGWVSLNNQDVQKVIRAVFDEPDMSLKVSYMLSLAVNKAPLTLKQHNDQLKYAMGLSNPYYKDTALAAVGAGWSVYTPDQQSDLFEAVLAMLTPNDAVGDRIMAMSGLGMVLEHIGEAQRTELVNKSLALEAPISKAGAITCLSPRLHVLTPPQRNAFVTHTLKMDSESAGWAICGLGVRSDCLTVRQRNDLVDYTLQMPPDSTQVAALKGLAEGFEFLTPSQRIQLVEAAVILADSTERSRVIEAMGAGLAFIQNEQRDQLFKATLQLPDPLEQAIALAGLARGLPLANG